MLWKIDFAVPRAKYRKGILRLLYFEQEKRHV